MPIARGTRCHDSIPRSSPDVSLARSLDRSARAIARGLLFTMRDESNAERSVNARGTKFSRVCSRGWSKTASDRPGVLSPRTLGSNIRRWKRLFGSLGLRTDHSKLLRNWRIQDGMCAICANMCFPRYISNETEMLTPSPIRMSNKWVCVRFAVDTVCYDVEWNFGTSISVLITIHLIFKFRFNKYRKRNYTKLFLI